ncbi:hypothetical protein [Streptosporangium roseum]|uniref:hypothetical protein n=1 Tax=Streptosporangium roseum TaxID=2001 RepID=UPI0004CD682C|nr:hypothetical protein [Streptosporangium roseum]
MILVTGASGALGKLVAGRLAGRDDLVAGSRSPEPSPAGPPVRRVDFDDPASLADVRGVPVGYRPSPLGAVWAALAAKGVPPYQVAHAVSMFANIGAGLLAGERTDLPVLLGVAPRPVRGLVADAVRAFA